jgi:FixJ family two-component response regulator
MTSNLPLVLVLDDDVAVLRSLARFLGANGYAVRTHGSAEDMFMSGQPNVPACLLLDQHLAGTKGTEVHAEMQRRGWNLPTVFLTADWDIHLVVRAMRGGADNYLAKPYDPAELLQVVKQALERGTTTSLHQSDIAEYRLRAAQLTTRERVIISLVAKGMLNKQIADHLQLAVVTVKLHRGRAMQKLRASNAAELGRIAMLLGL